MEELTSEDIKLIMEALNAWKGEPILSGMFSEVVGASLKSKLDINKEEEKDRMMSRMNERTNQAKVREEQVILISAKLIKMRDKIEVINLTKPQ